MDQEQSNRIREAKATVEDDLRRVLTQERVSANTPHEDIIRIVLDTLLIDGTNRNAMRTLIVAHDG